jgi:hypothetical protein
MSVIEKVAAPATFCTKESQRFWDMKGRSWWLCSKTFSTLAFKAVLEDVFGGEEHIETFCYDEVRHDFRTARCKTINKDAFNG